MRLDLSSPFALAASLLEQAASDDCMDLRFDPVYTGNQKILMSKTGLCAPLLFFCLQYDHAPRT